MSTTAGRIVRVLVLAALVPVAGAGAAGEDVLEVEKLVGTVWYGLYVVGQKIGYMSETSERATLNGREVLTQTVRMRLLTKAGDRRLINRIELSSVFEAEAPYRLILVENEDRTAETTERLHIKREGDEFLVTRLLHGRTTSRRVAASAETLRDGLAVARFIAGGPEPGDTVTYISFDDDALADVEQSVRVVEIVEEEWRGEAQRVFVVEERGADAAYTGRYLEDGTIIRYSLGDVLTLKLETEAEARAVPKRGELFELRREIPVKGLDVAGEDIAKLTLVISALPERVLPELAMQRVEKRADGAFVVTLAPGALPAKASLSDEDRKRLAEYLEATDEIQADEARIRRRARRIVRREDDPLKQARAISRWVYRHVAGEEFSNYETALDVLIHLEGDCTEHTLLFVALCRAAGLPAREVSGLVYAGPAQRVFAMHRWAQVYVGDWVDVDPTLNQFPADATHITLDTEGDRWFDLLGAFGEIRIEVVRAE